MRLARHSDQEQLERTNANPRLAVIDDGMVLALDSLTPCATARQRSRHPPPEHSISHLMIRIRTLAAAVALTLSTVAPFAIQAASAAATRSSQFVVYTDDADDPRRQPGAGAANVLLGSFGPLTVVSQTATQLVVTLPTGLLPGNYVLSVKVGSNKNDVDESIVTIGAVGPMGPAGPAGFQGSPGPAGPAGATGATGAARQQGAAGPAGTTGPTGQWVRARVRRRHRPDGQGRRAGPVGSAGPMGPQGPAGAIRPRCDDKSARRG